jgi:hypothetical protein
MKNPYLPDGYYVNNLSQIVSPKGKICKINISNSGYYCFSVKEKGKFIGKFLHRALCFEFVPKVENKDFVNHKDGNKLNNDINNLEWCTKSENTKHAYKLGLKKIPFNTLGKFGKDHNRSKSVLCLTNLVEYGSMSEASRKLGISISSVSWSVKHKKPIFGMHFQTK